MSTQRHQACCFHPFYRSRSNVCSDGGSGVITLVDDLDCQWWTSCLRSLRDGLFSRLFSRNGFCGYSTLFSGVPSHVCTVNGCSQSMISCRMNSFVPLFIVFLPRQHLNKQIRLQSIYCRDWRSVEEFRDAMISGWMNGSSAQDSWDNVLCPCRFYVKGSKCNLDMLRWDGDLEEKAWYLIILKQRCFISWKYLVAVGKALSLSANSQRDRATETAHPHPRKNSRVPLLLSYTLARESEFTFFQVLSSDCQHEDTTDHLYHESSIDTTQSDPVWNRCLLCTWHCG